MTLLPEGFRDRLPDFAGPAERLSGQMRRVLASHGYGFVLPPLAEFESVLSAHCTDQDRPPNRLRLTDPVSQRTLALRSDMTVQVGRIAATRLAKAPRPLRLAYSGQVLKLRAGQLNPDREMRQVGAELIGTDSVAAAREIVSISIETLKAAGATGITLDLTLPDLIETLAASSMPLEMGRLDDVRRELDMKDAGALKALGAQAYLPLLSATGPFELAIAKLASFSSDPAIAQRITALQEIISALPDDISITLDPTERHGFEYQSWFGFSLFAQGVVSSLGRGGTYRVSNGGDLDGETATGFSLYPDALFEILSETNSGKRCFLPIGHEPGVAAQLRVDGWVTVAALSADDCASALECSHILQDGSPKPALG